MTTAKLEELRSEYIGKVMTVEELAEKLPSLWVAVEVIETDPINELIVLSGRIIEIVQDSGAKILRSKYRGNNAVYVFRTTCEMNVGYINGAYIKEND